MSQLSDRKWIKRNEEGAEFSSFYWFRKGEHMQGVRVHKKEEKSFMNMVYMYVWPLQLHYWQSQIWDLSIQTLHWGGFQKGQKTYQWDRGTHLWSIYNYITILKAWFEILAWSTLLVSILIGVFGHIYCNGHWVEGNLEEFTISQMLDLCKFYASTKFDIFQE